MTNLGDRIDRLSRRLPSWLVDKVPRDHWEPDTVFQRRRKVVAGSTVLGASLLGVALSTEPDSKEFYGLTAGVAGTWLLGGFTSGPLHLGYQQRRTEQELERPVVTPIVLGLGAFGLFYAAALVAREVPFLDRALTSILSFAHEGNNGLALGTALANGAAEEVFFRGALYAAAGVDRPVLKSTAVYTLATVPTRNPALVVAAGVMGTLFAFQRRASGGIQAPMLTHVTWSTLMFQFLPPLFTGPKAEARRARRDRRRASAAA